MPRHNRRQFLKQAAASSSLLSTFVISGTKSSGNVIGANERIRVAVCGLNNRGRQHLKAFANIDGVEISHLVDVDTNQFQPRTKYLEDLGAPRPECLQDLRRAMEDDSCDAVSIATCNHTHSLLTIWACQAGKDVYVEKPLSHNLFEGRQCVEAARKYQRVVQHGTQQRSDQMRANEIAAVQSGNYGKLLVSKGYCCKPRWSIGFKEAKAPPSNLNFDLWLGPASQQPYHDNLVPYNWHWFWDFGNGDTGNQGVHELDVARWVIPGAKLPQRVWSLGGRFAYKEGGHYVDKDQGETPNMQLSAFEYGDVTLLFETRGLVEKHDGWDFKVLNEYYTTEGVIRHSKFYPYSGDDPTPVQGGKPRQVTAGEPFSAFIHAVRSRRPEDNNADAEVGHYSSALCHLANISYRLGSPVPFNSSTQALGDNRQVVEAFETLKENCHVVGVDLQNTTYQMGRVLQLDERRERFVNDDEANTMLTRAYRRPFVVPEMV